MQLQAASTGESVPRENFDALIQSVFDSAVNLRLADEDRLITMLISDHYELPQGIRIATKELSLQSLTPYLHAASRGGILRFDSSPLTVDLRGAPIWKCRIRELNPNINSRIVQKAWTTTWDLLGKEQKHQNTDISIDDLFQPNAGSSLSQRMGWSAVKLVASVEQFDVRGTVCAAKKMIGLGPGITPSGDDILIGFLAGLWSMAGSCSAKLAFIHSFGDALIQIAKQTSEISRTYIYHATQGQFSSSLSNLVEAIATGASVEQNLQMAVRVGHSSGMDSVTGLLIGLCVWSAEPSLIPFLFHSQRSRQEVI